MDWQPGASLAVAKKRATLLGEIRRFFAKREILEVETPLMSFSSCPEANIEPFTLQAGPNAEQVYLHTSPEWFMKRMLAAGFGPIYQICKVFRKNECSRLHNPEFTMLEWYRPGYTAEQMRLELQELLLMLISDLKIQHYSYQHLFHEQFGLDPHVASAEQLARIATQMGYVLPGEKRQIAELYDFILTRLIDKLDPDLAVCVYDFPIAQCAYAALDSGSPPVAKRFELFYKGMEIANGYQEITDRAQLQHRLKLENERRKAEKLTPCPFDERTLTCLAQLGPCAGIALGVDRLLMALCGADQVDKVLSFAWSRV